MAASSIYQRTEAGCLEIQLKKQGLTQSERLILIVVDGRASLLELSEKLKGLEGSRISRAIERLAGKQLIYEVLLPTPSMNIDVIDAIQIDRFLQQDPLDPVTIISFDADYDDDDVDVAQKNTGSPMPSSANLSDDRSSKGVLTVDKQNGEVLYSPLVSAVIGGVDFYIPLVKINTAASDGIEQISKLSSQSVNVSLPLHSGHMGLRSYRGRFLHMLWLLFVGVGFLLVSLSVWGGISRYLGFT
jgi:hypothetical protein